MIYLDYAATTPISPAARDALMRALENFANPSSPHEAGLFAERIVKEGRAAIGAALGVSPQRIYFTSGGTEANNWAVFSGQIARKRMGGILTTRAEHPSLLAPIEHLQRQGVLVNFLNLDKNGKIYPDELAQAMEQKPGFVAISHVNNETGAIQDIAEIGRIIKARSPETIFHIDAAQSFCKININIANIDTITISGHKIGAPKGIGALFIRDGLALPPMIFGGGQENRLRSGTENVPGIAAMGAAAAARGDMAKNMEYIASIRNAFIDAIRHIPGLNINIPEGSPYILSISIENTRPEIIVNALSAADIHISTGAACSARKKDASAAALHAQNIPKPLATTALRISFAPATTE